MNSEEDEFDDDTTDIDDEDDLNTTEDDDEDDEFSSQPIHFRECLRLIDAALTSSNPPILPRWCASEQIEIIDDPMLFLNNDSKCLSLPLNKRDIKIFLHNAQPLNMKIDIVDGISFFPTAYQISSNSFQILNPQWQTNIEPYLKTKCISEILQLNPNEIQLKISNLILLKSCQYPRQYQWTNNSSSIAKLYLTLPSLYKGGKETIKFFKEKHIYDLTDKSSKNSFYYTIVPISNECQHEIDFISNGYKFLLVYDILPLTSTIYYNVHINESIMIRLSKIFETWIHGLEHDYHGYSSKIIIPFSDTYQIGNNLLLYGIDRIIGTILRRTIEIYHSNEFLLYQGIIQPNRSNDGTIHACRLLTEMNLINSISINELFHKINLCLGNCNETYSGNIFLRKTRSQQGNLISIEQFHVSIWCLVPINHKYDLLIDNIPYVLSYLEKTLIPHYHQEIFCLINWLLTTTKKINFNSKNLLHQLIRLSYDQTITNEFILLIRQLFEHKKFLEQFFPMNNKQDYEDIIYLLNYSKDSYIQLYLHQVFHKVLQHHLYDTDRIKDAIKFIGILTINNINSSFLLVLIHELLLNIFKTTNSIPSITDLTNLLSLLSLSMNTYQTSCEILSQQIIRQIQITTRTTTSISTITNLLRAILIPTLIQIYRNFLKENQTSGKRKYDQSIIEYPSWFLSLYQTCLSLLNAYCSSPPSIPIYDHLLKNIDIHCCSICQELFIFLENSNLFQKTFLISKEKIFHFDRIIQKFNPLIILTKSMTSDRYYHQINLIKMSNYDDEISRENNLLRSLLQSNHLQDQSQITTMKVKRFKSSI